jgi:hypothetical protein
MPLGVDTVKVSILPLHLVFSIIFNSFLSTALKPEYSAAATELKPKYVLAGIDVNKPENSVLRKMYNITGFPTLLYFE